MSDRAAEPSAPIAVLGAGLRLPGGVSTTPALWAALRAGRDVTGPVPADRWDPVRWGTPPRGAFLDDPLRFDAAFFGMSPREAADTDPAQRLLLEVAWEALEQGGRAPDGLVDGRVGVWVGLGLSDWSRRHLHQDDPGRVGPHAATGSLLSMASGRVAYALGLRGPALTIDTACSSSLVAVHLAAQALRRGEVDLALAGGANLLLHPMPSVAFGRLGALSADGRCRAFDADADGYVRGEGAILLALARLADAAATGWPLLGVLRGSAVNQDGRTSGLTAPSGAAQQAVIRAALADAGADPGEVVYLQAHGTGTPLGDPIELDAARAVFLPRPSPLRVGSAKTGFGHLETAAGALGLLTAALALRHGEAPPHLHLRAPNPRLDLRGIAIDAAPAPLPPGLAGVSAFGLSGTNAHLVLAPPPVPPAPAPVPGPVIVPISARSAPALAATARRWAESPGAPAAVAAAAARRAALPHRAAVVAADEDELARGLAAPTLTGTAPRRPPAVAFLCAGQGSQLAGMGLSWAAFEPAVARALDEACAAVDAASGDRPLRDVLADGEALLDTRWTQPALFALHLALAAGWRARGVAPDVLLGHSIGELSAAVLAGVFDVADGARLAVARGRALGALPRDGAMWAVLAPEAEVLARLGDAPIDLAAVNHPGEVVIAGRRADLDAAAPRLAGLEVRPLAVSHPFHSRWVAPALAPFEAAVRAVRARPPEVPVISAVDGRPLGARAVDPAFWRDHVRAPVRFADALRALAEEDVGVAIELSARPVLSGLAARVLGDALVAIPTLRPPLPEPRAAAEALARAWVAGLPVALAPAAPPRADLPPGAFEPARHGAPGPVPPPPGLPLLAEALAPLAGEPVDPGAVHRVTAADPAGALAAFVAAAGPAAEPLPTPTPPGPPAPGWGGWVIAPEGPAGRAVYGAFLALAAERPAQARGFLWADAEPPAGALGHPGVVRVTAEGPRAVVLAGRRDEPPPLDLSGGTALVTGATGGLGRPLLRWLAARGCARAVVVSRAGRVPSPPIPGLAVEGVALDLADPAALGALAAATPDLVAVVHAAGATADAPFGAVPPEAVARLLAVKAGAAAALDAATRGRGLRAFVAISSAAAWLGSAGQSAYAAANGALEGVIRARIAAGAPAHAVALGPLEGPGLADVAPALAARWAREGVARTPVADAIAALDRAVAGPPGVVLAGDFDPARLRAGRPAAPALLAASPAPAAPPPPPLPAPSAPAAPAALVPATVRAVLGLPPDAPLDPAAGLFDLGLDSVTAVELARRLRLATGQDLPDTLAFDHPTVERLAARLGPAGAAPAPAAVAAGGPIAIVGLSVRLPGGVEDPDALWALLRAGRDALGPVPPGRFDPAALGGAPGRAGYVDDLLRFDAAAFGLGAAEATAMDPRHRLLLLGARAALADAGLPPRGAPDTGVWVGIEPGDWARRLPPDDPFALTGSQPSAAAGRLSHVFGWTGPSVAVDAACASGLAALAAAVRELRAGTCARAVVGAASAITDPAPTRALAAMGALSPGGASRPFDAAADGYVRGEGCVVLVLEPLAAARAAGRPVWGVIEGVAVGHDGAAAGLTVPNGPAQAAVIRRALADAGCAPDAIDAVQCHGTGTPLGDPIEWGALAEVFAGRDRPLWLGAAKASFGHLEAASGLVGVAAALLALRQGEAPPIAGLRRPNPRLVAAPALRLPAAPVAAPLARVGVSAFGIAGTDAHVILAAPPAPAAARPAPIPRGGAILDVPHPSLALPRWAVVETPVTPALAAAAPRVRVLGASEAADRLRARLPAGEELVLDLRTLDPRPDDPVQAAIGLVAAHLATLRALPPGARVALVTRAADADPVDGALAGLAATVAVEAAHLRHLRVDLPPGPVDPALLELVARLEPGGADALVLRDGRWTAPRLQPAPAGAAVEWPGPVVVAGIGGGVGRALAAALPGPVLGLQRALPPGVDGLAWDLAAGDGSALAAAWRARGLPAPGTVVHAAGAPADAALDAIDGAALAAAFGARVRGALALRAAFPGAVHATVGSAAAVVGNPGQGAYAAAHGFLRALGGAALLGPVAGEGAAAGRDWSARGVRPLPPGQVLAAVRAGGLVLSVDWPTWARSVPRTPAIVAERVGSRPAPAAPADLPAQVRAAAAAVLGRAPGDDEGFTAAGLDSLGVVALARRLSEALGREVRPTQVFDHPTVARLAAALGGDAPRPAAPAATGGGAVAICAVALRMPGDAGDLDALHDLLASGRDVLGPTPPARWDDARYPELAGREASWLAEDVVRGFDPDAFGMSPREAAAADPQQRLLLALALEALERAGLRPSALDGTPTAVFVGAGDSGYLDRFQRPGAPRYADPHAGTGNLSAFASGRVAHALGLRGPNLTLNTACSSALVALHLARRALLDGEATVALAGAVHLMLSPEHARYLARLGATSPTGRCRTFDAAADGYARGEGAAVFVLLRAEEAQARGLPVLGLLLGSATNHDGAASGLTVPSGPAQEAVVRAALADARVAPDDVSLVETHGTGTPLGDPIEVDALFRVFGPRPPDRPLWLGAAKSNLGHLELAAGALSVAKVLGAFARRELAGNLHLHAPSPALALDARGYRAPGHTAAWAPAVAGVSGFGLSGTNVHLVLAPPPAPALPPPPPQGPALRCLSARSAAALAATAPRVPATRAAAHALLAWRDPGPYRAFAVGDDPLPTTPVRAGPPGPVAFLCAGQGSQWPGMGDGLAAAFPAVRQALDEARDVLGADAVAAWADERVHHTRHTQPALVALQVALARWWASLGVAPDVVFGHSVGQLAAAVIAGALPFADALRLTDVRARLLASLPDGAGAMAAVDAPADAVRAALVPGAALAADNHPASCTISGEVDAVAAVSRALAARGLRVTPLPVSHAFHSPLVAPVAADWAAACAAAPWTPHRVRWLSGVDAAPIVDPARTLADELLAPVAFRAGLLAIGALRPRLAVELGPHPVLAPMVRATLAPPPHVASTLRRGEDPVRCALAAAGAAFLAGVDLRPDGLFPGEPPPSPAAAPPTVLGAAPCWLEEVDAEPDPVLVEAWAAAEVPRAGLAATIVGEGPLAAALRLAVAPGAPRILVLEDDGDDAPARALAAVREGVVAVVTAGASTGERPALLGVHGLLRAVAAEDPRRAPRWLDVDPGADVSRVVSALAAPVSDARVGPDGVRQRVLVPGALPAAPVAPLPVTLITGGLSGLGLAVAKALRAQGAPGLVLVSRRAPDDDLRAWAAAAGPPVRLVAGDVADPAVVDAAVRAAEDLAGGAPIGVVHAAGALADKPFDALTPDDLRAAAAGKVDGFRHLDARLGPVAFFAVFGAGAALLGTPGQAAYAAANATLTGGCRARAARGAPVTLLHWGAWDEVGMAARLDPALRRRRAERGLGALSVARGVALLLRAAAAPGEWAILPTDWPRYVSVVHGGAAPPLLAALAPAAPLRVPGEAGPATARDRLAALPAALRGDAARAEVDALVRRVLGRAEPLAADASLFAAGLDSLLAIELKNALADAGLQVPLATILGEPTVGALAAAAVAGLPAPGGGASAEGAEPPPVSPVVSHGVAFALGVAFVLAGYLGTAWLVGYAE